ncbi:enoyl-CoA hydratase/isomerase [Chelatococcus reniformis]|uniref:Enoyl-CoA hydratase n=1 Tax=Chelatococcus reniformis TaxID=1494448 RepID=A0A916UCM0_9HYPH|nr:enoyl-CoA hydratase/isomerase [Chelatococcus reniformis]GGC66107.1 enoyl-CoA hydratase [Chelatococcus reniformis]
MTLERMKLTIDGPVAVLAFNHQEVLNALSPPLLADFNTALDEITDPAKGVRCLVLTGEGRAFCAGANLQGDMGKREGGKTDAGSALETVYHPILRRLRNLHCPIVTAVNGPAAGAGMSFALIGDLILCARSAYFMQAFRRIGLVPDCGSTWILPRLVGRARSLELSLLGDRLPAEKALEWGLVNRVYDDGELMGETLKLATDLANGPTVSLGLIRKLYWEATENSFEEQLDLERQSQGVAGRSEDFKEGVQAFLQKRPAAFKGR